MFQFLSWRGGGRGKTKYLQRREEEEGEEEAEEEEEEEEAVRSCQKVLCSLFPPFLARQSPVGTAALGEKVGWLAGCALVEKQRGGGGRRKKVSLSLSAKKFAKALSMQRKCSSLKGFCLLEELKLFFFLCGRGPWV